MKKCFFLVAFLFAFSFSGYCDTIDYWHVYYNDNVIARFNANSNDLLISLNIADIKPADMISVLHRDDTPCMDCECTLFVRDERNIKLKITEGKYGSRLSFLLTELLEIGKKSNSKRYDFYYWEQDGNGKNTPMKLVLQLTVK